MFNMGFTEMLFIAGLALILVGPKQLPEVARAVGRFLNELKRSTSGFTDELKAQTTKDLYEIRENARKKLAEGDLSHPSLRQDGSSFDSNSLKPAAMPTKEEDKNE